MLLYIAHMALLRVETREASYDSRQRLYTHSHSQAFAFFQRHRTGALIHCVTVDVRLFEDNAVELFSDLPFALLTVIGVLTMEASHAEIEEAARKSGVEQLVQRFPHGLETMVGERGVTLSGGERHHQPYQCIASVG